jgi:PleD family two-component response regulator
METLLEQFAQLDFSYANTIFHVTFSVGITEGRAITQEECFKMLETADNALYCAKKRGRRCVEIGRYGIQHNRNLRKLNIAIIDDDAIIRTMLKQYLTEDLSAIITVNIRAFRSGEHFFRDPWHVERAPFLIILDGIMPGMDGLEVLEKIRSIPHTDLHSVIMLTGRKEENDIVRALQLGADDYLTKPFKIGELGARIRRLLTRMNFI